MSSLFFMQTGFVVKLTVWFLLSDH